MFDGYILESFLADLKPGKVALLYIIQLNYL